MTNGTKVRTNKFYEDLTTNIHFLTYNPIEAGTIANIRQVDTYSIADVKLKNGKTRSINTDFLEIV